MGLMDRSKKRVHLWKKAIVHFMLCFVMGFFIGFAPTSKSSYPSLSTPKARYNEPSIEPSSRPVEMVQSQAADHNSSQVNRSLAETPFTDHGAKSSNERENKEKTDPNPRKQVIVVTPTSDKDPLRVVLLRRMANTLKLVPSPLLWMVVESEPESSDVSEILRRTGVMYRHLVVKESFTDTRVEMDHQRNLALNHIEHHRLSGIVHFAGLSNVYDLSFFDNIRTIEVLGTWPLAKLAAKRKKMIIEGPVCETSQVVGWHLKKISNSEAEELAIHISSFGFNSSILWDPERWGRLSSTDTTKQNSLKFVKQAVVEDEAKLKGIPAEDCSKVNLWQFHLSTKTMPVNHVPDSSFSGRQR